VEAAWRSVVMGETRSTRVSGFEEYESRFQALRFFGKHSWNPAQNARPAAEKPLLRIRYVYLQGVSEFQCASHYVGSA
jgi:hypothetical protein